MEYSFIMFKPDALKEELVEKAMNYLREGGIEIAYIGCRKADKDTVCRHYAEVIEKLGEDFKRRSIAFFENEYVIPMVVKGEGPDLIGRVRKIVGATDPSKAEKGTIRGDLGHDSLQKSMEEDRCCANVIHASDCPEAVKNETTIWFGSDVAAKFCD